MNSVEEHSLTCVGCANCENVCQKHAIKMREDAEGFFYPVIDRDVCIQCGKCQIVCPVYQKTDSTHEALQSHVAISKEKEILKAAASGGLFGTIAKQFLKDNTDGAVVGATFENNCVFHKIITSETQIRELQNSKYVQSSLNNVFVKIEELLKNNQPVLFSGTPCQVNALRLFLKLDYEKLYTIDIICHGVPSYAFLKKDLELYANPDEIKSLKFRLKNQFRPKGSSFILSFVSKKKECNIIGNRDPYFALFINGDTYRESCYSCKFAKKKRVGDITIGDCDSHRNYPNFHPGVSKSVVILNTPKGETLFQTCSDKLDYANLDLSREALVNRTLSKPTERHTIRNSIYEDLKLMKIQDFARKYSRKRDWKEKLLILKRKYL